VKGMAIFAVGPTRRDSLPAGKAINYLGRRRQCGPKPARPDNSGSALSWARRGGPRKLAFSCQRIDLPGRLDIAADGGQQTIRLARSPANGRVSSLHRRKPTRRAQTIFFPVARIQHCRDSREVAGLEKPKQSPIGQRRQADTPRTCSTARNQFCRTVTNRPGQWSGNGARMLRAASFWT